MKTVGIVCEYNPFHNGHARQLAHVAAQGGVPVCLMSGNFVQRGEPAVLDKMTRARAALGCGAALVLELPVTYALRSAEGFAGGAVELLDALGTIDALSFGCETAQPEALMRIARLLLQPELDAFLREELTAGVSFAVAREKAALRLAGQEILPLRAPNDILAVEYCKALLRRQSRIAPEPLHRTGDYHASEARECPSAAFLRAHNDWSGFVPDAAAEVYRGAVRHTTAAGERAWLARLRSMTGEEFSRLPYGSEGLWRRLLNACRTQSDLEHILAAAKTKRYARARLARMLACALLGIDQVLLERPVGFIRVLGADERGRELLRRMKKTSRLPLCNAGQAPPDALYAALERRAADLYDLFSEGAVPLPGSETRLRLILKNN